MDPDQETSTAPRITGVRNGPGETSARARHPLGDGHEARESGLRGKEVVATRVRESLRYPVTNGKELTGAVEEELEVHGPGELLGQERQTHNAVPERNRRHLGGLEFLEQRIRRYALGISSSSRLPRKRSGERTETPMGLR